MNRVAVLAITVVVQLTLVGCSTPGSSMIVLNYEKPKPGVVKITPKMLSAVSQLTDRTTESHSVTLLPYTGSPPISTAIVDQVGSGATLPTVAPRDPWSIVLRRVRIESPPRWFGDGDIAVLLNIRSGDQSTIDGKWILAYVEPGVAGKRKLNFDNLIVWSGITTQEIVIEVKLVDLKGASKDKLSSYLKVVKSVAGFIPAYGPLAQALVDTGEAINQSSGDYELILTYSKGFTPTKKLKYAAYSLLPQHVVDQFGEILWFDDRPMMENVMAGENLLRDNWCLFEITKGAWHSFDFGKAETLDDVVKGANDWAKVSNPIADYTKLAAAFSRTVGIAESSRLIQQIDFSNPTSISSVVSRMGATVKAKSLPMNDDVLSSFFDVLQSYLPPDNTFSSVPATPKDYKKWIDALGNLTQNYRYDSRAYKWVSN